MICKYDIDLDDITYILKQSGNCKGIVLRNDAKYIRKHYGARALASVEEITAELGYPIHYRSIKPMAWYPAILPGISLIAIIRALDFNDEDLRKMGWAAARNSIVTQIMMRYFASLSMLAEKLSEYWMRNYDIGSLTGYMHDGEAELYLRGLEILPRLFPYVEGYLTSVICMVVDDDIAARITSIDRIDRDEICYRIAIKWNSNLKNYLRFHGQ